MTETTGTDLAKPRPIPPAHVAPFVECLGFDLAFEFILRFGGAPLYLANAAPSRGMAVAMVGAEAVARLNQHPRIGEAPRIPLAKPWLAAVLAWRGMSTAAIARELKTSDVSVRRMLRGRKG